MNPYCAAPEMNEVHAELLIRAYRCVCVCGAAKTVTRPFCGQCWRRLHAIDQRFVPAATRAVFIAGDRLEGLALYDLCCDLLRDPNMGLIRKPKKREED